MSGVDILGIYMSPGKFTLLHVNIEARVSGYPVRLGTFPKAISRTA